MNLRGFYTLLSREVYRFTRLFRQTIIPPLITTLLFILIFGYSLGSHIREIQGVSYIVFILPGLAQLGIISNSYANSSTSLYMARMERSIENLLIAPLSFIQIVMAFIIGSVLRGLTVGYATLFIAQFFIDFPMPHPFLLFFSWTISSALFGALGLVSALLAESWDHIALLNNFILTPLIYLGGTFYSINLLPEFWQKVSYFNPIFYCIDSTRYAILGISDNAPLTSYSIIVVFAVISIALSVWMIKKGYKLIN